ncbi:hypothetical protein JEP40_03530 [Proteus vulgaris]|uniref:protein-tyrosine phosphatase family protein n=1 Tax=Proteus vulgaris TaxID=585 RepID=UPI0018E4C6A9|nr:protein-tyrosine phosphatase family protein [Proteus vulgaris]MBI6528204.1 hypothetical protein [Proteus vulgaris]
MFSKINFLGSPNVEKINRNSETKYVKGKNASHNSISHINNTNQKLDAPNLEQKAVVKGNTPLCTPTQIQQIYNQSSSVDNPPALPPKGAKVNNPPALPPKGAKVNIPPALPPKGAKVNNPPVLPPKCAKVNNPPVLPPRRIQENILPRASRNTTQGVSTQVPTQTKSFSILKPTPYYFDAEGNKKIANSSDFLITVNSRLKHNVLDKEDKLNESEKLFNNLISKNYLHSRYKTVNNSRFGIELCSESLLKYNNIKLPANIISGTPGNALRIASQYPKSDGENMANYLNSLIDNNIDTVYVLASDDDIKSKLINDNKYFMNNHTYDDVNIKDNPNKHKIFISGKKDLLDLNTYPKIIDSSLRKKEVNFVHIHNWKDHTAVDATKLKETLSLLREQLGISPHSNSLIHCLAGIGRTMEMFLVEKMMDLSPAEKQNTSLEEMVHEIREKRTPLALYEIGQLAELTTFALENGIPLLKK